jgi:hypothetical protein
MTDDELRRQVGTRVGTLIAGLGRSASGVSRNRSFYERWAIISPTWLRGLLKDAGDVFKPGVEGDLARRFWGGVGVLGVGSSVGLTMMLKGAAGGYGDPQNPDWNEVERDLKELLIDPRSPRNVWNPDSSNFLSVELPNGQGRLDVWGPFRPLLRTIASPVTGGVKGTAEEVAEARKAGEGFQAGVLGEVLVGLLGGSAEEMRTQAGQWTSGRMGLIPRQVYDGLRNRDFFGQPIRTAETGGRRALQQTVYSAANLLPSVGEPLAPALLAVVGADADLANVVGERPKAVPEGLGTLRASLIGAPLSAIGLNVRLASQDPGYVKQAIRDLATAKGLHAGNDPVAWYRSTSDLNQAERSAFQADNPRVLAYIEQRRLDAGAREDKPTGRQAQTFYQTDRTRLVRKLREQKQALADEYRAGRIDGNMYRQRRSEFEREYSISLEALAFHRFGTSDLDAVYDTIERHDPFDKMLDEYYAIRPQGESQEHMNAFFAARSSFLAARTPEEREMFDRKQETDAIQTQDGGVELDFVRTERLMNERMQIAPFAGISLEDGRAVQNTLARVRDLQRLYPYLDRRTALMMDRQSDPRSKMLSLMTFSRVLQRNPRLTLYEKQHPELFKYYGNLTADAWADALAS